MRGCNENNPYAFVSYAHDDEHEVIEVVNYFRSIGYNLWTDANLNNDNTTWKAHISQVLGDKNCKILLFFRSKKSLSRDTIAFELRYFTKIKNFNSQMDNDSRIVIFDLYPSKENHSVYTELFQQSSHNTKNEFHAFLAIEDYISEDANALSFSKDQDRLKLEAILKEYQCLLEAPPDQISVPRVLSTPESTPTPISLEQFNDIAAFELKDLRYNVPSPLSGYVYILDALIKQYPGSLATIEKLPQPALNNNYAVLPNSQLRVLADVKYARLLSLITNSISGCELNIYNTTLHGGQTASEVAIHRIGDNFTAPETKPKRSPSSSKPKPTVRFSVLDKTFTTSNQTEMVYTIYEELLSKYPHKIDNVLSEQKHVSAVDYTSPENKSDINYFNSCKTIIIGDRKICIGASLSMKQKKVCISKLCELLEIPEDSVQYQDDDEAEESLAEQPVHTEELPAEDLLEDAAQINQPSKLTRSPHSSHIIVLGEQYEGKGQADCMRKAYEILLTKYPDKLKAVVHAQDNVFIRDASMQEGKPPENIYMRSATTFIINEQAVAVGTAYDKIAKIAKLNKLCEILGIPTSSVKAEW